MSSISSIVIVYPELKFGTIHIQTDPFTKADAQNWLQNGGLYRLASGYIKTAIKPKADENGIYHGDAWRTRHRRYRLNVIAPHIKPGSVQTPPNVLDWRQVFKIMISRDVFKNGRFLGVATRTFFAKLGADGKTQILPLAQVGDDSRLYYWQGRATNVFFPKLKQVNNNFQRALRLLHIETRLSKILDRALWGINRNLFIPVRPVRPLEKIA